MGFEALDDLYREVILDHYNHPRHHETITPHDVEQEGYNPLCGDQLVIQLQFENDVLKNIGFSGKGCSISQAAASILTEDILGKSIPEIEKRIDFFKNLMQGKVEIESDEGGGDIEALVGVRKFPVRIKCALLAWTTLQEGLEFYKQRQGV